MRWIDITLVIASIIFVMLFGLKFAHKQDSTNSYFAAGGSVPAWAIGMSIFATLISSVTFLAYPGAAYGGSWIPAGAGSDGADRPGGYDLVYRTPL